MNYIADDQKQFLSTPVLLTSSYSPLSHEDYMHCLPTGRKCDLNIKPAFPFHTFFLYISPQLQIRSLGVLDALFGPAPRGYPSPCPLVGPWIYCLDLGPLWAGLQWLYTLSVWYFYSSEFHLIFPEEDCSQLKRVSNNRWKPISYLCMMYIFLLQLGLLIDACCMLFLPLLENSRLCCLTNRPEHFMWIWNFNLFVHLNLFSFISIYTEFLSCHKVPMIPSSSLMVSLVKKDVLKWF